VLASCFSFANRDALVVPVGDPGIAADADAIPTLAPPEKWLHGGDQHCAAVVIVHAAGALTAVPK
jgi:hypothetical protein